MKLRSPQRSPQLSRRDKREDDDAQRAEQVEQRARRRKHLDVTYHADFDLLAEIHDIAEPLAQRVAAEPSPMNFAVDIDDLSAAVHKLVVEVSTLIATADACRMAAHLPYEKRDWAVRTILDIREKPQPVVITDTEIVNGLWVAALTEHVGVYSGQLSDLLSRAALPGTRRGLPSVSEQLVNALRVVDLAANELEQHLNKAAFTRKSLRRNGTRTAKTDADKTRSATPMSVLR